jgi:hypothetical protein
MLFSKHHTKKAFGNHSLRLEGRRLFQVSQQSLKFLGLDEDPMGDIP